MKRLFIAFVTIITVIIVSVFWWKISLTPVNSSDTKLRTFNVLKGDGVREITNALRDQGLIRNKIALFLLIKKLGIEKNIQAGSFQLAPSMSAYDLVQKLTLGTEDIWITIPEGWRSEQILEYLGQKGNWKIDEGYLFPETYRLPKQMPLEDIRSLLKKTFLEKVGTISVQDLVLASLIEREAKTETDRPLVASVLKNRLDAGMSLDVDATIQYILGKPGDWWPKEVLLDDLKIKSPYNTYLNPSLPPAPICNPGLSAIKAARSPAKTDYLYYISDKSGVMHYAKTLSDHNANVAKYLQ